MARTLKDQKINQIIYISMGGAIAAIILFIIVFNVFSNKNKNSNNLQIGESNSENIEIEEANSQVGKSVNEVKDFDESESNVQIEEADNTQADEQLVQELSEISEEINGNEIQNTSNNAEEEGLASIANSSNEVSSAEESNATQNTNEEQKDPTFEMPVEGEIVKHYGKDKLIYSDTLKEWTTHLGIDIKADKTTVVKAAAEGVVKSIKNDPRYGLTVVLEHQNGFTSVYANLLTAEFVVVGENVKVGQTLGTVGNSATFEILDDAHLHFEILKDGGAVDPEMYVR